MNTQPISLIGRKILVVDDDIANIKLIEQVLLHEKFSVETALSGEEALRKIEDWNPELVLLDYHMPGINGVETLRKLRAKENYTAAVFVSANTEPDAVVECLESGADDYIRKPFRFQELVTRVKVRFRIKDLNDELKRANQKLAALAETDDLTGLYNMRSIYPKIDKELRRAKRYERQVAAIMMDIDHFKEVNDKADHLFGSFVIKELGRIIQRTIRETDFAARYGGDEFLIVLTETNQAGAFAFTDRLRAIIEATTFTDGKDTIKRTCSFGCSISGTKESIDARDLVRRADHALYEAKGEGRNRVKLADKKAA